ncbi:NAD(P)/FAD-dependent oxidoreductase [Microbacterium sp. NPDC058062]|uniref:NAD(P)/FAD-dependent oxidoreductase n=1 Tax=Microbacterium sp. NPDC058062 TaxID=3346320 RepID=UPI0036D8628B
MRIVVVGGGHAGVEVCAALRRRGFAGDIDLVEEQHSHPYQRPPLSKDSMAGSAVEVLPLQPPSFFETQSVHFHPGVSVTRINRAYRTVELSDLSSISYDHLVLATGAQSAPVNFVEPGATVHTLRTDADAVAVSRAVREASRVIVIGGGFIGLEVAAGARNRGVDVLLVTPADRVLGRSVSEPMSAALLDRLTASGVSVRLRTRVARVFQQANGPAVALSDGSVLTADVVVVGIGVRARTRLAQDAGLDVDDGVIVDEQLTSSDPAISAIGDCARFPSAHSGFAERLESVQNATDQARHLAATLMGGDAPYSDIPWFWSVQGTARLQIAGLGRPDDEVVVPPGREEADRLSIFRFQGGELRCVESLDDAPTHMAARRALAQPQPITMEHLVSADFALRSLVAPA